MRTLKQRRAVAAALLAVTAPLVVYLNYDVPLPADIKPIADAIPKALGKWTALEPTTDSDKEEGEKELKEQERQILETDAILTRAYKCANLPVCELSVVSAVDNPNAAHSPELCYKGAHWTETRRESATIYVGEDAYVVNRRLFARGTGVQMWVLYWFKAGPTVYESRRALVWAFVKARFQRRSSSYSLIQVRSRFGPGDHESEVLAELEKFAAAVIPAVNAAIP